MLSLSHMDLDLLFLEALSICNVLTEINLIKCTVLSNGSENSDLQLLSRQQLAVSNVFRRFVYISLTCDETRQMFWLLWAFEHHVQNLESLSIVILDNLSDKSLDISINAALQRSPRLVRFIYRQDCDSPVSFRSLFWCRNLRYLHVWSIIPGEITEVFPYMTNLLYLSIISESLSESDFRAIAIHCTSLQFIAFRDQFSEGLAEHESRILPGVMAILESLGKNIKTFDLGRGWMFFGKDGLRKLLSHIPNVLEIGLGHGFGWNHGLKFNEIVSLCPKVKWVSGLTQFCKNYNRNYTPSEVWKHIEKSFSVGNF
ncbi:hypothetical protein HK096_004760 [Nowakowskiella sp. JEL0078]|nr:hypothetical protein HK096_004760 [Nowakowskiella sp. JEL0078]